VENNFCQLWLSCKDEKEAAAITDVLLAKHLVACAKQIPVGSTFRWQGKIEHDNEVLLLMESRLDLFDQIESEVAKLHSYDTFVLEAMPVAWVSKSAHKWLRQELKNG
jgi:periplasmic divalent cation tolerance protein